MNKHAEGQIIGGVCALIFMMIIIGILGLDSEKSVLEDIPHWFLYWFSGMVSVVGSILGATE